MKLRICIIVEIFNNFIKLRLEMDILLKVKKSFFDRNQTVNRQSSRIYKGSRKVDQIFFNYIIPHYHSSVNSHSFSRCIDPGENLLFYLKFTGETASFFTKRACAMCLIYNQERIVTATKIQDFPNRRFITVHGVNGFYHHKRNSFG